ncbi:MAG: thioredoxin family protein [Gammaproteobacteria bacterium]|nr:thioredoxin family protein [Gammaproteobacteria bacterium]
MSAHEFDSLESLQQFIADQPASLVYFSTPQCNVCKVLKPKVVELLETRYPEVNFVYSDVAKIPEIAAQMSVLTVPTLVLYFDGRESARFVRNFSLGELESAIERPYSMIFG